MKLTTLNFPDCISSRVGNFELRIHMGLTGFDSKDSGFVSMPGIGDVARKNYLQTIIGETQYALAA